MTKEEKIIQLKASMLDSLLANAELNELSEDIEDLIRETKNSVEIGTKLIESMPDDPDTEPVHSMHDVHQSMRAVALEYAVRFCADMKYPLAAQTVTTVVAIAKTFLEFLDEREDIK